MADLSKKVVDAEMINNYIKSLSTRQWVFHSSMSGSFGIEGAINNAINAQILTLSTNVNQAISSMLRELSYAIEIAAVDPRQGLCGLCRPDPFAEKPED